MLPLFQLTQMELERFRRGPLSPHFDSFASWLSQQGYSHESGMRKIRLISLLSCWLEQRKIRVRQLDELQIAAFLKAQRNPLRRHHQVRHTLGQLLQHLRRSKIIPNRPPTQAVGPAEHLIHDYRRFLTEERGLCQTTLANYVPVALRFLSNAFRAKALHLAKLTAADIDWNAGAVLVRGKSARQDRLPLPSDVGCALAAYLQEGRPFCATRCVFVRMKAPHEGFSSSVAVCDIVRRALLRAGLQPERKGAHLLRHSLATQMLRRGATMTQIGQILRHQSPQTTEIYAKVDLAALQAIAQPWPGDVRCPR